MMMKNYDQSVETNDYPNWPKIPDSKTRYWQNLFIRHSFIQLKVSITSGWEEVGIKKLKKFERIYWLFANNWWCLWKFGRL